LICRYFLLKSFLFFSFFGGIILQNVTIYDKMTNAEREVADLLKNLGIKWLYDHPVFVWDENNRPRVWAPDFFLEPFGIYIEVCGSKEFNYEYRRKIFDNNGHKVIFLHLYKETDKWKRHFISYLQIFIEYRSHKLKRILNNEN